MRKRFRRITTLILATILFAACLYGCNEKVDEPVTLTMWHVYGEQASSPMDALVEEFNSTIGQEKGIIINVTANSNATSIGQALLDAQAEKAGSKEMPDLFFCHPDNAVALDVENLVDWHNYFTDEELSAYNQDFVAEGMIDDHLTVFPVSKSTHMLFLNGSMFARFSADTGVTLDDLATWDGFFATAEKFHTWSDGKSFCSMDYILRAVELSALSKNPDADFYTADGWYDFENATWKTEWNRFADALTKGCITVSDLYSNTQVMAGETLCGLGSSAAILYYNDTVTYPDNTSEPMNLIVLPIPTNEGKPALDTQAGVGLCAYKTTDEKMEAAAVFAKWLTESDRNLDFVTSAGYMPVTEEAFDKLPSYRFEQDSYRTLYTALETTYENYTFLQEPSFENYYARVNAFYDIIRSRQNEWALRYANGESAEHLKEECWEAFRSIE